MSSSGNETFQNIFPTEVPWENKTSTEKASEKRKFKEDFWIPGNNKKVWDHVIRHRRAVSSKVEPDFYTPISKKRFVKKNLLPLADSKTLMQSRAPTSVINESIQRSLGRKYYPEEELCSFGRKYEIELLESIHKYLEVDTYHQVAYVGPSKGSLAKIIAEFFCLQNPIKCIYPGIIHHYDIASNTKRLAFKIAHVAAEEYFKQAAESDPTNDNRFDRIVLVESVQHFQSTEKTLAHVMNCLRPRGKIMVIHRPASTSTLPLYTAARSKLSAVEVPYMKIINAFQKTGADVQWELEHVPTVIEREKWLAMLRNRFPTDLESMSEYETDHGIRELVDGPLKYMGEEIELEDRLLFITASQSFFDCAYPTVQRIGASALQPFTTTSPKEFKLEITDNIASMIPNK